MSEATSQTMPASGNDYAADAQALRQKATAAKGAVAELASEARRYATSRAADMKESAAGWAQAAKHKASHVNERTVEFVQRRPYQSLAIAAGIGFLAGLLLKRR